MKTLLLMPDTPEALGGNHHAANTPMPVCQALTRALTTAEPGGVATLTLSDAARDSTPAVRLARRLAGRNAALAVMGFLRRRAFDVVFTDGEDIGWWLAALFQAVPHRPAHVVLGHRLSQGHGHWLRRALRLGNHIDALLVHAQAQRDFAEDYLGVAPENLALIPPPVDDRFFRPDPDMAVREDRVCAAGLQWRDYATLLEAVTAMPGLHVDLAAYPAPIRLQDLSAFAPSGEAGRCDYRALRALYASSLFVVVPLCDTDFAAGATTILQAMAMGKAVIATRTEGQTDVIVEGVTGLTVPPGDVAGWRHAIARLREDGVLRERLGRNARRWVEENAALDVWAGQVAQTLRASSGAAGPVPTLGADSKTATLHSLP